MNKPIQPITSSFINYNTTSKTNNANFISENPSVQKSTQSNKRRITFLPITFKNSKTKKQAKS